MSFERAWEVIQRHRIVYAMIGALLVASLVTVISMALYVSSGASRLDLSRPGYEKIRDEVSKDVEESPFRSSGPLTEDAYKDFQSRFTKRRDLLNRLGAYDSTAVTDKELRIAPATPEEPVAE